MIYSCIGAQGVGKSTVINKLREMSYYATDGMSRPLIRAKLHKSMSELEFQTLLNDLTIHHHTPFLTMDVSAVFFTRSILDCIAYGRVHGLGGKGDWEEKAIGWFNENKHKYVFMYFPIEFDIERDNEREADREYQRKVDQECKNILEQLNVPYHTITGTVEDRVNKVSKLVYSHSAL